MAESVLITNMRGKIVRTSASNMLIIVVIMSLRRRLILP